MDLRSGQAYWPLKNGLLKAYPKITENLTTEVAIIGGGITGALMAYTFASRGIDVVVLEKREIGWGSTSASTAMLQYEIDTDLYKLTDLIGKSKAERCYWQGIEAIEQIEEITKSLSASCDYSKHPSLYLARTESTYANLSKEYEARANAGLPVSWVSGAELHRQYGIHAEAGIKSDTAAVIDAYKATHELLKKAEELGAIVLDRTTIVDFKRDKTGYILSAEEGNTVSCRKVVFATGYESVNYLNQEVVKLKSTYALATEPFDVENALGGKYLLWEMASPYFYLRPTRDNRLLMGGGDIDFKNPTVRDLLIEKKIKNIRKTFIDIFPEINPPDIAFQWAGTFGETEDGLPYIGSPAGWDEAYFALGYGGNGITYSMLAANIIADSYQGIPNPNAVLYKFDR